MNLDELKTAWQQYDSRLASTEEINRKVIISMIRERSVSRIARIRRRYSELLYLFGFYSVILPFTLIGDPFDYTLAVQYVPPVLLIISCILMVIFLIKARAALRQTNLEKQNLQEALVQIIAVYVKYRTALKYTVRIVSISSILLVLSHILINIPQSGIWVAVVSVLLFCALLCYSYYYTGKDPKWRQLGEEEKGFRADLEELKELNPQ